MVAEMIPASRNNLYQLTIILRVREREREREAVEHSLFLTVVILYLLTRFAFMAGRPPHLAV